MIDTHAHLTSPAFISDLPIVLTRARATGISSIICVSETLSDAHAVLNLTAAHPGFLHPALGLHPEHVTTLAPAQLSAALSGITSLLQTTPAVAIGEVGLDYTPRVLSLAASAADAKRLQADAFAHFLSMSQQLALPLSVHSRAAGHHALAHVVEAARRAPVAVCMHAFDGRAVHAERALRSVPEGLYFSVPPSVVRDDQLRKLVRRVPTERLLLESDAPALAPSRGERNEPANLVRAAEIIAEVKGVDVAAVRQTLAENTERLFTKVTPTFIT